MVYLKLRSYNEQKYFIIVARLNSLTTKVSRKCFAKYVINFCRTIELGEERVSRPK